MATASDIDLASLSVETHPDYVAAEQRMLAALAKVEDIKTKLSQGELSTSTRLLTDEDIYFALAERKALKEQLAEAESALKDSAEHLRGVELDVRHQLRASVLDQHQRLAGAIKEAAELLYEAVRAEREFRDALDDARIGFGDPLKTAAIQDLRGVDARGRQCGFTVEELLERYLQEVPRTYVEG